MRPGRRALRVDVIGARLPPVDLLRGFHRQYPKTQLDVVMLFDADTAIAAVRDGTIDATFRAIAKPLPDGIESVRVLDEPLHLLAGPSHPLATLRAMPLADLAGHRISMPYVTPGTEWSAYYEAFAAAFGLSIDATGPNFGSDALLDVVADSSTLTTIGGEHTRLVWPAHYDIRRIALHDPTPIYPHSLIWRSDNPHPALAVLRDHLAKTAKRQDDRKIWVPKWARRAPARRKNG